MAKYGFSHAFSSCSAIGGRNAETMARIISNWPGEPFDVEMIYEREPASDKGQLFAIPGVAAAARTR